MFACRLFNLLRTAVALPGKGNEVTVGELPEDLSTGTSVASKVATSAWRRQPGVTLRRYWQE